MEKNERVERIEEQNNVISIGNTTFYVTSRFVGKATLQYLIKRLIQEEIEQECF